MDSARPWEVGDEYWDFEDFIVWLKENEHLIEGNLTDKNNMKLQIKQGLPYIPPQKDEIIIIDVGNQTRYYYWIAMDDKFQHLVWSSALTSYPRIKVLPRNARPSSQWRESIAANIRGSHWHKYYRVQISDSSLRIHFINWNQSPWRDVK